MKKAKKDTFTQINEDKDRLLKLFDGNDSATLELLEPLIQNAVFMQYTLRELQKSIIESGYTDDYKNGANQHGVKISANVQAYNSMVKNYNVIISKLAKYVTGGSSPDELEEFLLSIGEDR